MKGTERPLWIILLGVSARYLAWVELQPDGITNRSDQGRLPQLCYNGRYFQSADAISWQGSQWNNPRRSQRWPYGDTRLATMEDDTKTLS